MNDAPGPMMSAAPPPEIVAVEPIVPVERPLFDEPPC